MGSTFTEKEQLLELEAQIQTGKREELNAQSRVSSSIPRHYIWIGRGLITAALLCLYTVKYTPPTRHSVLPKASPLIGTPSRPLEWGDVNFIHTTDTHGWLLGHQKLSEPEPNASGTLGDLYSFIHHMKDRAAAKGVDLLVVDSGDMHDGNGLSDGFPPGGVNGHETNKIFARLPYDALAIGNHELYKYPVALDVHKNFAPKWKGRYLTSNVNITVISPSGQVKSVPLGERYAKFTTSQGRKVTALGVLFNFANYAKNTTVQSPELFAKEQWFQDVIEEEPDFFLLLGHMAVDKDHWPFVFSVIRRKHPHVPIFVFGGHTHIRDCVMLDDRSMALESGRYMETVGWMSATLPSKGKEMKFTRRYLDANRVTYHTDVTTFDTPEGVAITKSLRDLADKFNLGSTFGVVPKDYYLDRVPYPSEDSVVSLFVDKILPAVLPASNPKRAGIPSIILANAGSQRFDVFKGPFTRNDQFIVSPFKNSFLYLHIPYGIGRHVLKRLNKFGAFSDSVQDDHGFVASRYNAWRREQFNSFSGSLVDSYGKPLTLGYVTTDSCPGGHGDDTPHRPIPIFDAPGYVQHSNVIPSAANSTMVDVIFLNFFLEDIVKAANELRVEAEWDSVGGDGVLDARVTNPKTVEASNPLARNALLNVSSTVRGVSALFLLVLGMLALSSGPFFDLDAMTSTLSAQSSFNDSSSADVIAKYETVPGYFFHDNPHIDAAMLSPPPPRFGLIDSSESYWTKFKTTVKKLNEEADPLVSYKVVFIGRHGEGYHNVAEAFYGTKAWDDYWALQNGNGAVTWGPDAKLTALGIKQAQMAHKRWVDELHSGGGIPLPTKIYSSPLSRAAKTLEITFHNVSHERPLIMENLREIIGVHTCDKRLTRSAIHKAFPEFDIEKGFAEEDLLWKPDVRETSHQRDIRVRRVFDKILHTDDTSYKGKPSLPRTYA
ncbi:hypothetical protein FRB90_010506 [Tulasnella sp. 427]|nr:hypothetical protein FRB90_010506 [Tulasnella sp. 427]